MTKQLTRQRCDGCDAMCLPHERATVPDEPMTLCADCATARGLVVQYAAAGDFEIYRPIPAGEMPPLRHGHN